LSSEVIISAPQKPSLSPPLTTRTRCLPALMGGSGGLLAP
jgi:hypothetical protein